MRTIKIFLVLMISGLFLQSCLKDREAERKAEEMRILNQYILNNGITVTPNAKGLYYIEQVAGTGDSVKSTDWIEFSYTARVVSNPDVVVLTSDSLTARDNSLYNSNNLYGPKRVQMNTLLLEGLFDGIRMMKQGGKARLIFPSSLGYGRISFGSVPPYSSLIFDIELVHVIKNIVQYERAKLNSYLIANNITEDSTSTGLYYHEILAGTGEFPVAGKTVNMSYKGSFLDGKVFNESDADNLFTVGYDQVIPGVDEGIRLMKEGGKALIIIPYYLGYGADGYVTQSNNDVFTLVYPYTTLVYEIELKDIQ